MKTMKLLQSVLVAAMLLASLPLTIRADYSTSNNPDEMPPFLCGGVPPNLMLMLDNSASMYDLAEVGESGLCYDGPADDGTNPSYDLAVDYAGYFRPYDDTNQALDDLWYKYNTVTGQFEEIATPATGDAACGGGGVKYNNTDVCVVIDEAVSPMVVLDFAARGNFLNWVAASKFDIEKQVLTGGKYDDLADADPATGRLVLESRGCLGKRYVKKVAVQKGVDGPFYLTLGVVNPEGGANPDLTQIEVYPVTETGFQNDACAQLVLDMADPLGVGQLAQDIDDCIGVNHGPQTLESDSNAAFNHSIQDCWYIAKHGEEQWLQTQNGSINRIMVACETLYVDHLVDPGSITTDSTGYVCYGQEGTDPPDGYVGYCWDVGGVCVDVVCTTEPATGAELICGADGLVHYCNGKWNQGQKECTDIDKNIIPEADYPVKQDCTALEAGHWVANADDPDTGCVIDALRRYCGRMSIPEVIDPSDQEGSVSGEFWNVPAIVVDSGVIGQLGDPLAVLDGYLKQNAPPTGVLQRYADVINIGAMAFNDEGQASECGIVDPDNPLAEALLADCANKRDGAQVISYIDRGGAHTELLIGAINDLKAVTWTPLAEAMYTAIGYYTQNTARRINSADFITAAELATLPAWANATVYNAGDKVLDGGVVYVTYVGGTSNGASLATDTGVVWTAVAASASIKDPVSTYCMDNAILVITEGASTVDIRPEVVALSTGIADPTGGDGTCNPFYGSTYLDNLTYYAWKGANIYPDEPFTKAKKHIRTFVVQNAIGRAAEAGDPVECDPTTLLSNAATQGSGLTPDAAIHDGVDETVFDSFLATNMVDFRQTLNNVLFYLAKGVASGSAASVISSSRSGEGALYQAIFWPGAETSAGERVEWIGEVHALLVNAHGEVFEDTDQDRVLSAADEKVVIYFDGDTRACYGTVDADANCDGVSVPVGDVKYLWSAAGWLNSITDGNVATNRGTYISNTKQRYIYTWNDLNDDGLVTANEWLPFVQNLGGAAFPGTVGGNRGAVINDFGLTDPVEANNLINWLRGQDQANYRSRQWADLNFDGNADGAAVTWRLGDVIHSTPMLVSRPAENYHFLYQDGSYAQFLDKYKNRRGVVYVGGNDGMLHAFNAGFYKENLDKFCVTADCSGEAGAMELGAELWAYVPYNLLPHLKYLADAQYGHKYMVDQRPRVFDVRIFDPADGVHEGGWGTILVGGMRFGGSPLRAKDIDLDIDGAVDYPNDQRIFTSAYFIFDVTDPETPPVLLGEFTRTENLPAEVAVLDQEINLGFSTSIPAMVPMVEDGDADEVITKDETSWTMILGSGPTALDATSDQEPMLVVLPLDRLRGMANESPLRVPPVAPQANDGFGRYLLPAAVAGDPMNNGFISSPVSVNYELNKEYMADVVYFGTVEHNPRLALPQCDPLDAAYTGVNCEPWHGKMYRLVTRKLDAAGNQTAAGPSDWAGIAADNPAMNGENPNILLDTHQPITAPANVGWDGRSTWVYFGTGRYYNKLIDTADLSPQTFYGVKEPEVWEPDLNPPFCKGEFTWATVDNTTTIDLFNPAGQRGLLDVTGIKVYYDLATDISTVDCVGCPADLSALIADPVGDDYDALVNYVAGIGCGADDDTYGADGWRKNLVNATTGLADGERNLGQATLLGGLVTFTSYLPKADACECQGESNLYAVYYKTGTPWKKPVYSHLIGLEGNEVVEKLDLGRGLALTPNIHVGQEQGGKAFVQTSTGAIVGIEQPNMPIGGVKSGRASWFEGMPPLEPEPAEIVVLPTP